MATGIPPKDTIKRKKIAVRLSYDGKEESNTILNGKYQNFVTACSINGGGSNKFFFGDNLEALLFLLNNGYKGKISLIYIDPPLRLLLILSIASRSTHIVILYAVGNILNFFVSGLL